MVRSTHHDDRLRRRRSIPARVPPPFPSRVPGDRKCSAMVSLRPHAPRLARRHLLAARYDAMADAFYPVHPRIGLETRIHEFRPSCIRTDRPFQHEAVEHPLRKENAMIQEPNRKQQPLGYLPSLTESEMLCACGHKRKIHGLTAFDTRCWISSCECPEFTTKSKGDK